MSPEERSLVMALFVVPGRQPMSNEEFLKEFGAADGAALGLDLLREAVDGRDPVDVELALVVSFRFGFSDGHLQPLMTLAFADWHQRHEDVASALGELRSPASVDALEHLARWVPAYLEFDDARALAVKAIWGLGGIGGDAAHRALKSLASSECGIVAENAVAQFQK
jgi:PBS lyase HEAT-like repeat-containing protein